MVLEDCGEVCLGVDELVTLAAEGGKSYDVVRNDFGFCATPSLNRRLPESGLRPALVRKDCGRVFVMLVEEDKQAAFRRYLEEHAYKVLFWLDDEETLDRLTTE